MTSGIGAGGTGASMVVAVGSVGWSLPASAEPPVRPNREKFAPTATTAAAAVSVAAPLVARSLRRFMISSVMSCGSLGRGSDRTICLLYTSDAADDLLCVDLG